MHFVLQEDLVLLEIYFDDLFSMNHPNLKRFVQLVNWKNKKKNNILYTEKKITSLNRTYFGYGILFGPTQLSESVKASPVIYFKPLPPLHCSCEKSDHGKSACENCVVVKMMNNTANILNQKKTEK